MSEQSTDLLPRRLVAERYNVTTRTVVRWENDPDLRFPQPIEINKRRYYHEAELTAWDRANASRLTATA
jgi:hypothetical protein